MFDHSEKTRWEKIVQYFKFKKWRIQDFIYHVKKGLYNIVTWFCVIWNLDNTLKQSQYDILYFYFKDKKKSYSEEYVDPRTEKAFYLIINILDRLSKDGYNSLAGIEAFREEFGRPSFKNLGDDKYTLVYGDGSLSETDRAQDKLSKIFDHADYLKKQDIDYLSMLLKKYHHLI